MEQIFYPADILLPDSDIDMNKWSVIACDQFTSEPGYWDEVEKLVDNAPSTLRLTLPEVYLDTDQEEDKLSSIRQAMKNYMDGHLLTVYKDAMIYIEREDSRGKIRAGIIGAVDLDRYDYHKGSTSPVRATEGTIEERIPPRLRVRQNASVELPHIMMLIDDRERKVIESLGKKTSEMKLLYDFDLMKGGGHLKGWLLTDALQKKVIGDLQAYAESENGVSGDAADAAPLIFAVGDGNHSLATAKEYYEQLKADHPGEDLSGHPARFALAEVVNLHSPALEFEAIHRIVTNVNADDLFHHMTKELGLVREDKNASQSMTVVLKGQEEKVYITRPSSRLTVGSLQHFLDRYMEEHSETEDIRIDYIHGRDNLKALTWQNGSIGFLLPEMTKEDLFPSVKANGALPRKTFSMGHAEDKRYYTECRRIRESE